MFLSSKGRRVTPVISHNLSKHRSQELNRQVLAVYVLPKYFLSLVLSSPLSFNKLCFILRPAVH